MFKSYSSITNHYDETTISFVEKLVPENEIFVALEKIHGANFSIVANPFDDLVYGATRNSVIPDNDNFYNHRRFVSAYGDAASKIARLVKDSVFSATGKNVVSIQLVGELFGGSYGGVTNAGESKIQKGVQYSPNNEFMLFDVIVNYDSFHKDSEGKQVRDSSYLDYADVVNLSETFGIPMAPTITTGTLKELLAFDVESFESVVFKTFDLPKIENNIAEGIIIRPIREYRLGNGSRVIFKKKTEKFKEKIREERPRLEITEKLQGLIDEVDNYLTETRVDSALSKYPITEEFYGKIIGEFSKDVKTDYSKDLSAEMESLSDDEAKELSKMINSKSVAFVKAHIFK